MGREPGKEGIMVALGHGDGGIGGTCISLDARAGRGRVLAQGGESVAEGGEYPFMLGGGEVDRVAIGGGSVASAGADTRAQARPSSTSRRETFASSVCCAWSKLAQVDARCPKWGGGPALAAREARGSGAVGRKPGVRPVLDPVVARRSAGPMGDESRSGPEAEGGGESVLVVALSAVPVLFLGDAMVDEVVDMTPREARKAARGMKSRGGATRTMKGGWSATCVVTRGAGAELL